MRRYTVVLVHEPERGYAVTVPVLPDCVAFGVTAEEAIASARRLIALHLACLLDDGDPLPWESTPPRLVIVDIPEELLE